MKIKLQLLEGKYFAVTNDGEMLKRIPKPVYKFMYKHHIQELPLIESTEMKLTRNERAYIYLSVERKRLSRELAGTQFEKSILTDKVISKNHILYKYSGKGEKYSITLISGLEIYVDAKIFENLNIEPKIIGRW